MLDEAGVNGAAGQETLAAPGSRGFPVFGLVPQLIRVGADYLRKLIAKVVGKPPLKWTKHTITLGDRNFASAGNVPALIYPNPLNPAKYVILNSGLTVEDRDYPASDYLTPRLGDFAIIKVKDAPGMPEPVVAGLFDENWRLPKEIPLVQPPAAASAAAR